MAQPDTDALLTLVDALRARGVRRYRASDGLELEFGPPAVERAAGKPVSESDLREAVRNRSLDNEWAHVGGPPPWVADPKWNSREHVEGDGGADD